MLRNLLISSILALGVTAFPAHAISGEETSVTSLADVITADSCFAHIDSNLYTIQDQLPRYTEQIEVGDIDPAGYDIEIRYPEYKTLSNRELKLVKQLQKEGSIAADAAVDQQGTVLLPYEVPTGGLDLKQYMAVSRKQGFLNVSFSPIVRHEGQWKRILSCQIRVTPKSRVAANGESHLAPARVSAAERWTETSVLSTGKWAKIRVKDEGIYQLTAADLEKMGFSSISNVKIYGYGGLLQDETFKFPNVDPSVLQTAAPDDLEEVSVMTTDDGRLLFWAEGTLRYNWNSNNNRYTHAQNHYSNYSYYFITEGTPTQVEKLAAIDAADAVKTITTVPFATVLDKDGYSWYNGGRRQFDTVNISSSKNYTYKLASPGYAADASGSKSIDICFGASSNLSDTHVSVYVNDTNIGSIKVDQYNSNNGVATCATSSFSNTFMLNPSTTNNFVFQTSQYDARLDFIRLNYPRTLEVTEKPYSFSPHSNGVTTLSIAGADSHTHLWRIAQMGSPTAEVAGTVDDEGAFLATTDTPNRRFVFFDDSKTYASPEYVGAVDNQNLHADSRVDYVIIVPANGKLTAQAERLGKIHEEREGLTYRVVRADQLYNEFSSGTPDANAYRRYLKMLYDRAGYDESALPKYCLLIGKSPWDARLVTSEWANKNADDYILSFEMDASTKSIGSVSSLVTDDFFALLDDGEGATPQTEKLDVALGRMVCITEADAELLVDKVESYINNKNCGSWKNTVAMLGDDGDSNGHMKDADAVVKEIEEIAPNLNIQKVYWDRYTWTSSATGYSYPQATARIRQLMTDGALLFNYSGHGGPAVLSHHQVVKIGDFKERLSPYMTLWVLASCEIYPFDSDEESLAEAALYVPDGGAIGFMCATRAVYADKNVMINRNYSDAVLKYDKRGNRITMGEALRISKVNLVTGVGGMTDTGVNHLKYVFFGDPALVLSMPTGKIVLDSINGKALTSEPVQLPAGGIATFSGHVCAADGSSVDTDFDGTVETTLFDREETITCKDNQGKADPSKETTPYVFKERSKSVFKGSTKAENGKFTVVAVIPRDISYTNDTGRASFYAINTERTKEYNGCNSSFYFNGTAEMAEPDTIAPRVVAYINSIDNPDYTITDENPVLIADVYDECGINNAGVSLGHDIELVLDGNKANYININSYFNYEFGSYQNGQIIYPMSGIEKGSHTAEITVWDVNNNSTTTDVHFIVRGDVSGLESRKGYITATKNPASTSTNFITYFPANTEVEGLVTYEVYDTRGRCVFKEPISVQPNATSSTFSWDLCGNDHQPLPAGIYFYRAVIVTTDGLKETEAQKLIITRQ